MAGNMDKRILQMQFDNKEFELNIKKSQKSVEDFKKAMDFDETSKGLSKFSETIGKLHLTDAFSKMGDNLQKITDKFTGLGTMSERVLSQIRQHLDSMMARFSAFVDSMTTAQVSAGMDKYEMLNKSVQTIKAATGESEEQVYAVLKRLNDYTDQTSYNFSDMAANIGKFTSVGIDLQSAERQMEGIANWAARSGAGIQEASRAMYNLSQAMGVGKMTKIDWKSIENAGMATKEFKEQLIAAGVSAGTLVETVDKKTGEMTYKTAKSLGKQVEVNYQNVADTLAKGWATKDVLSSTLERYYYEDLYYENESEALLLKLSDAQQKTFDQMMQSNNHLDASEYKTLQKMGLMTDDTKQKLLDLAVSQNKLTKDVTKDGKTIYKAVDKTGKNVEFTIDNMEESLRTGWFDKSLGKMATSINTLAKESYESAQKCLTFTDVLNAWRDQISTGWMKSFQIIFGDLTESIKLFSDICNRVGESIDKIITLRNDLLGGWKDNGGRTSLLEIILGDYGKEAATGAYGFLDLLENIGSLIRAGLMDFIGLFAGPATRELMKEDPEVFRAFVGVKLADFTKSIENFLKGIRDFFNAEVEVNGKSKTRLQMIYDTVQGISGALALAWTILKEGTGFIGAIFHQLEPSFNEVFSFFSDLGLAIYGTADKAERSKSIKKFFTELAEIVTPITNSINKLISSVMRLLRVILGLEDGSEDFTDAFHNFGEIIKTIADIISKVATPIIDFFTNLVDAISKLFKSGINGESLKNFGADLGSAFGGMMSQFADNLPDSLGFLKDWIHSIFGNGQKDVENEANNLFGLIGRVNKQADKTGKSASRGDGGSAGLMGLLTGTNVAVWVGVAGLISVTLLINKAKKTVGKIGEFFSGLGSALKDGFKIKYEQDDSATRFLKIAKGLALIAAAITVLGLIPLNALVQGGIAMAAIMGAMFGLMFLLKKTQKAMSVKDQLAFTAQIFAISAGAAMLGVAVGILALALIPFSKMSWGQYAVAMAGLGGVLLQLVGFMALVKITHVSSDSVNFKGIYKFAFSIAILMMAILPFADMNWDQYARVMAGLGGVLLQFIAFMTLIKVTGVSKKSMDLSGLVKFALSIAILVFAIRPFANMNWDQYGRVMAGLGGILLQFIAFMGLTKLLRLSKNSMNLTGLIKFAIAVWILVKAITPFANLNWEQYGKVMAGLGGVLLQFIAFMTLIKVTGVARNSMNLTGLIKFAAAIWILVQAIMPFANINWDQYAKVMAGLGGILIEFLLFMGLMKIGGLSSGSMAVKGLVGFAIGVWILMQAIMPFAQMNLDQYLQVIGGLGGILLELLLFMGIMKTFKLGTVQVAGLAAFAGGMSMLVNSLKPFLDLPSDDWQPVMKALAGLGGALLIMVGFMALMKKLALGNTIKQMLSLAIFAGIFAGIVSAFAAAMLIVKDMDWKVIAAFSGGIAVLLIAIAGAALVGNAISIRGILMLSLAITAIMGVFAIMIPVLMGAIGSSLSGLASRLSMFSELMSIFSDKMAKVDPGAMDKLMDIARRTQSLLGIIVDMKFKSGDMRAFTTAISEMTLIADQLTIFQARISTVKATSLDELKKVLSKALEIFQNEVSSISSYSNIASLFGTAMYNLGTGIEIFNNHTGNIGNVADNSAIQLIQALSGCAGDLNTIYKMNIDHLTSQLSGLGGALMLYASGAKESQDVTGFDPTDEKSMGGIKSAIALLQAIGSAFAEEGVTIIPDNMPSTDALGLFGAQLAALAGALVQFETAGASLGEGTDKALDTLDFFQKLKAKLDETSFKENLVYTMDAFKNANDEMINQNELEVLGKNIEQLGLSLGQFAKSTTQVNSETGKMEPIDYTMATTALDSIAKLGEKLPSVGGAIEIITGRKQDLYDLATQVNLLGSAMKTVRDATGKYDENTKDYKAYDFSNTIDFLNAIQDLETSLPYIGGLNLRRLIVGDQMTFDQLGAQLAELGAGLGIMSASIAGEDENGNQKFDADKATLAANLVSDHILPIMKTMATDLPKVGGFLSIVNTALHGRDTNMGDIANAMAELGTGLAGLGKGITDGGFESVTAVENAFTALEHIFGVMTHIQELFVESNTLFGSQYYGMETFGIFKTLTELMNFMTEGISEKDSPNGLAYSPIIGSIKNFVQQINEAFSEIVGTSEKAEEVKSRLGIFKLFAEGLNALTSTNMTVDWAKIGEKMTSEIAAAITKGGTDIFTSYKTMMIDVNTKAQNIEGINWNSLGIYAAMGVAAGFTSGGADYVNPAATAMMIDAYNAGMAAIDAASPSKLFMEMGGFVSQGLAIGIDKGSNEASNSTESMMLDAANIAQKFAGRIFGKDFESSVMSGAPAMMAALSTTLTDNLDSNPTISPVLDLTNLEAGLDRFARDANGRQITLNTRGITAATAGIEGRGSTSGNEIPTSSDYSGLYERIESLGSQLGELGKAFSKMKLVLDSGVVAGGVTDDVDKNIGRKIFYAERNN